MLAGSRAKEDGNPKIGYMATFPIPEELRLGNAIMRGAKVTCPECTMDVRVHQHLARPDQGAGRRRRRCSTPAPQVVFTGADTRADRRRRPGEGQVGGHLRPPGLVQGRRLPDRAVLDLGSRVRPDRGAVKAKTYTAGYEYFDADSKAMGLFGFMDGETPQQGRRRPARRPTSQQVKDTLAKMLAGQFGRFDVVRRSDQGQHRQGAPARPGQKLEQSDLDQFPPGAPGAECKTCMYWWNDGHHGRAAAPRN